MTRYNSEAGWNVVGGTSAASPLDRRLLYADRLPGGRWRRGLWTTRTPTTSTTSAAALTRAAARSYLCEAIVGYDGPTGLGTPDGSGEAAAHHVEQPAPVSSPSAPAGAGASDTSSAPSPSQAPVLSLTSAPLVPVLSGLSLTHGAIATLSRRRPMAFQVSFAFALSAPARVRATLAKLVRTHGHLRFRTLPYSLTIAAKKGRSSAHLRARSALAPGTYLLTLTPAHGVARSLTLHVA